MTLIGLLGNWGVTEAVIQDVEFDAVFSTIVWIRLVYAGLIFAFVVTLVPLLARFYDGVVINALIAFAGSKSLLAAVAPFRGAMTREFRLTYLAFGQFVSLLISVAAGLCLILELGFGVWGLIVFYVLQDVLNALSVTILTPEYPRLAFDTRAARWFVGFVKGVWVSKTTGSAENQLDDYLLGALGGTAILGIYSIAWKVTNAYTTIFQTAITKGILPAFSRLQGNPEKSRSAMEFVLRVQTYVVVPMHLFLSLAATDIVILTFGPEWSGAGPILSVLAFAGLLYPLVNTIRMYYFSIGQPRIITVVNLTILAFMLLFIPLGLHLYGGTGVAASMVVTELAAFLLLNRNIARELGVSFKRTFYPSIVAGGVTLLGGRALVTLDIAKLSVGGLSPIGERLGSIALFGVVVAILFYPILYHIAGARLRDDVRTVREGL